MSSPEIKVTFGALSTAQADVAATAARIRTQLDDLKRYLAPMVATWNGQAADRLPGHPAQVGHRGGRPRRRARPDRRRAGRRARQLPQQAEQANAARWGA